MKVLDTDLEGVLKVEPIVYEDDRGFFSETYSKNRYISFGIDVDFVQDCHSRSTKMFLEVFIIKLIILKENLLE